MNPMGVQRDAGAGRAAAEQIDQAARPYGFNCVGPDLGDAGGIDGDPGTLMIFGRGHHVFRLATATDDFDGFRRAQIFTDV